MGQTSLFGLAAAEFRSSFQSTAGKPRTLHSKVECTDRDTVSKTSSVMCHFISQKTNGM